MSFSDFRQEDNRVAMAMDLRNEKRNLNLKNMNKYILKDKEPIVEENLLSWGKFMEDSVKRIVAKTTIGDVLISTVFLGIDYNFYGGDPILFETIIFGGEHEGYQERYSTWKEAEAGHKKAIGFVENKAKN